MRHGGDAPRLRRLLALKASLPTLLLLIAPLAIGGLALGLVARAGSPIVPERVDHLVIPPGTAAKVRAGLPVGDVLPEVIRTAVGRTLIVENRDTANHVFGPIVLAPGQRWQKRFGAPGEISMVCSVYPDNGFRIHVDMPPGLGAAQNLALWGPLVVWGSAMALVALLVPLARWGAHRAAARQRLRALLLVLPGLALAVVIGRLGVLAGLAGWANVAGSPAVVGAWTLVVGTGFVVFAGWVLLGGDGDAPSAATGGDADVLGSG